MSESAASTLIMSLEQMYAIDSLGRDYSVILRVSHVPSTQP